MVTNNRIKNMDVDHGDTHGLTPEEEATSKALESALGALVHILVSNGMTPTHAVYTCCAGLYGQLLHGFIAMYKMLGMTDDQATDKVSQFMTPLGNAIDAGFAEIIKKETGLDKHHNN